MLESKYLKDNIQNIQKLMSIPLLKKLIRSLSKEEAEKDLAKILKLKTSEDIRKYILEKTKKHLLDVNDEYYAISQ